MSEQNALISAGGAQATTGSSEQCALSQQQFASPLD
jgi:hypothetical protein